MLSRIAESLFWIGRYLDRADGTARILDVHMQLLLEDRWIDEDSACRSMMSVMGVPNPPAGTEVKREDVLHQLAVDLEVPSSIGYSIRAARENARRAREIVSAELWEVLNTTNRRMPQRLRGPRAHDVFQWVLDRTALAYGVVESNSARDESWQFFTLGRAIERIDMIARLLATRSLTPESGPSWTTILRSCGAYEPYLRTYQGGQSPWSAAEFLLLDRLFPRSITYSTRAAELALSGIDPTTGRAGLMNPAQRALGRIRHGLEYTPVSEILEDLPARMEMVQAMATEASEAIRQQFFPTQAEPNWIGERG